MSYVVVVIIAGRKGEPMPELDGFFAQLGFRPSEPEDTLFSMTGDGH